MVNGLLEITARRWDGVDSRPQPQTSTVQAGSSSRAVAPSSSKPTPMNSKPPLTLWIRSHWIDHGSLVYILFKGVYPRQQILFKNAIHKMPQQVKMYWNQKDKYLNDKQREVAMETLTEEERSWLPMDRRAPIGKARRSASSANDDDGSQACEVSPSTPLSASSSSSDENANRDSATAGLSFDMAIDIDDLFSGGEDEDEDVPLSQSARPSGSGHVTAASAMAESSRQVAMQPPLEKTRPQRDLPQASTMEASAISSPSEPTEAARPASSMLAILSKEFEDSGVEWRASYDKLKRKEYADMDEWIEIEKECLAIHSKRQALLVLIEAA